MKKYMLLIIALILIGITTAQTDIREYSPAKTIDTTDTGDTFIEREDGTLTINAKDGFLQYNISSTVKIEYVGDIKETSEWEYLGEGWVTENTKSNDDLYIKKNCVNPTNGQTGDCVCSIDSKKEGGVKDNKWTPEGIGEDCVFYPPKYENITVQLKKPYYDGLDKKWVYNITEQHSVRNITLVDKKEVKMVAKLPYDPTKVYIVSSSSCLTPNSCSNLYEYDGGLKLDYNFSREKMFGFWRMDGNTNDDDQVIGNFSLTSSVGSPTSTEGAFEGAYNYDGNDGFWRGDTTLMNLNTKDLTVCAWANASNSALGSHSFIFDIGDLSNNGFGMLFTSPNEYHLSYYVGTLAGNSKAWTEWSNWNHWCAEMNGTHLNLFINGKLNFSSSKGYGSIASSAKRPAIGVQAKSNDRYWYGGIDHVQYWNRSLGTDEIYEIYQMQRYGTGNITTNFTYTSNYDTVNLSFNCEDTSNKASCCAKVTGNSDWYCENTTGISVSSNSKFNVTVMMNTSNSSLTPILKEIKLEPYEGAEPENPPSNAPVFTSQPTNGTTTNTTTIVYATLDTPGNYTLFYDGTRIDNGTANSTNIEVNIDGLTEQKTYTINITACQRNVINIYNCTNSTNLEITTNAHPTYNAPTATVGNLTVTNTTVLLNCSSDQTGTATFTINGTNYTNSTSGTYWQYYIDRLTEQTTYSTNCTVITSDNQTTSANNDITTNANPTYPLITITSATNLTVTTTTAILEIQTSDTAINMYYNITGVGAYTNTTDGTTTTFYLTGLDELTNYVWYAKAQQSIDLNTTEPIKRNFTTSGSIHSTELFQYINVVNYTGLRICRQRIFIGVNFYNKTKTFDIPDISGDNGGWNLVGGTDPMSVAGQSTNTTVYDNCSFREMYDDWFNLTAVNATGSNTLTNVLTDIQPIDPPSAFLKDGIVDCDLGMNVKSDATLEFPLTFRGVGEFVIGAVLSVTGFKKENSDCKVFINDSGRLFTH